MSINVRLETGHGYLFVDSGVKRKDARNGARNESDFSRTGYLAVINDAAENDYVASRNDRIRWLGGWERENRRYDPQSLWFWEYNASTEKEMVLSSEEITQIYSIPTGREESRIIGARVRVFVLTVMMVGVRNKLWSWIVVGVGLITVTLIEGVM